MWHIVQTRNVKLSLGFGVLVKIAKMTESNINMGFGVNRYKKVTQILVFSD